MSNKRRKQSNNSFFMDMIIKIMGNSISEAVKQALNTQSYMKDHNQSMGFSDNYTDQRINTIIDMYLNQAYNQMINDTKGQVYEEAKKATEQAIDDVIKLINAGLKI